MGAVFPIPHQRPQACMGARVGQDVPLWPDSRIVADDFWHCLACPRPAYLRLDKASVDRSRQWTDSGIRVGRLVRLDGTLLRRGRDRRHVDAHPDQER